MSEILSEVTMVQREADCLYTQGEVEQAVATMATAINERMNGRDVLVLPIMTGGIVPAGMLIPRFEFSMELDYLHATRYRGDTTGSELHWRRYPSTSVEGRVLLLLDDIYDEGLTLASICEWCRDQGAAEVHTAVLFEKKHDRNHGQMAPDFVALEVEDRYVFGFGMDYKHYLRNAAGVYAVKGL